MRLAQASVACFALALAGWAWLRWVGPLPGDRAMVRVIGGGPATGPDAELAGFFQALGTPAVTVVLVLTAAAVVLWNVGGAGVLLVLAAAGAPLASELMKQTLTTPRIDVLLGQAHYPSGHVTFAAAFFGALAVLGARHARPEVVAVAAGLAIGMGPARLVGHQHLVGDVVAGYLVGAGWLLGVLAAERAVAARSPATPP